jgi:hypothetical protein
MPETDGQTQDIRSKLIFKGLYSRPDPDGADRLRSPDLLSCVKVASKPATWDRRPAFSLSPHTTAASDGLPRE